MRTDFASCFGASSIQQPSIVQERMIDDVKRKGELFKSLLQHTQILKVWQVGLWLAVEFASFEKNKQIIDRCIEKGGRDDLDRMVT